MFGTAAFLVLVVSILTSALSGGWMWLLSAVTLPVLAGSVVMHRVMTVHLRDRRTFLEGPAAVAAIIGCTLITVAVFSQVVAFAFPH
jgi:hypothetical protein